MYGIQIRHRSASKKNKKSGRLAGFNRVQLSPSRPNAAENGETFQRNLDSVQRRFETYGGSVLTPFGEALLVVVFHKIGFD
jgi:hypothetical protein